MRSNVRVFINCLIKNPTFDSQTKETLTTKSKDFGSTAVLEPAFLKKVMDETNIVQACAAAAAAAATAAAAACGGGGCGVAAAALPLLRWWWL